MDITGSFTDGTQPIHLVNGVNMPNNIVLNTPGGATEPFLLTTGSATYSGNLSTTVDVNVGGIGVANSAAVLANAEIRLGGVGATTGGTITYTGSITSQIGAPGSLNGGVIMFRNANIVINNGTVNSGDYFFALGRASNTNITLMDSGSVVSNVATGAGAFDGGNIGGSGAAVVNLTMLNNSIINVHAASFDIAGNTGTNTVNMSGNSVLAVGLLHKTNTAATTFNFNGGTIRANASDNAYTAATPFLPFLTATTFNIGAGGAKFDDNGFSITVQQPLLHGTGTTGSDGGLTILGTGTMTLSATSSTYNGPTAVAAGTLVVAGGTYNTSTFGKFTSAGGVNTPATSGLLTVAAGTIITSDGVTTANWQVNGTQTIRSRTATGNFQDGTSIVNSLTLAGTGPSSWTGKVDLNNNALILNTTGFTGNKTTVLSTVLAEVKEAQNGTNNNWTGVGGITSSTVAANPTFYGLAVADNSVSAGLGLTSFRGLSVADNNIIVVAAHVGDITLDGKIDIQDLNKVVANWQKTGAIWSDGDTTGAQGFSDGKVDIQDLNAVVANWQATGLAPLVPAGSPGLGGGSAVPEPASLAMLALGGAALLTRRRRR